MLEVPAVFEAAALDFAPLLVQADAAVGLYVRRNTSVTKARGRLPALR
jgi:hypothetical protein